MPFLTLAALATASIFVKLYFVYRIKDGYYPEAKMGEGESRTAGLVEGEDVYSAAFDNAAIGMGLLSSNGLWLQVNRTLCEMLGYSAQELLATGFQRVVHPEDLGVAFANIKELLKGSTTNFQLEQRYLHKKGQEVSTLCSISLLRDAKLRPSRLILQLQDITARKKSEEQLARNAFHDALTGLPNRALFMDHLRLSIARKQRNEEYMFAVLFLDIDRFKVINDSLGHLVGDQLLVGVGERLNNAIRAGDTVARVGGDEFTILLDDLKDEIEAIAIAGRIQNDLKTPFSLYGHDVFTTASIGIAPSSINYSNPEDIMRDADTAMYRAKSLGKARHEVFDKAMHAMAMNVLQLETDLRHAVARQEFFLQYQPIVSLDGFSLCGFEALVRWQHPVRGLISPIDFIPIAEDTGQIVQIGKWALREACRQMHSWHQQFKLDTPLFVSVNLSGKQFSQPDLIEQVSEVLEETGFDPNCLKLEITESMVMENIKAATALLRQLRALGLRLSIDDFGTGYSSLSYIHRFPIDTLKIDRSFVIHIVDNSENIEIVRTIVMLAQNLGLDVIAEGVETKEQVALLRKLGCEYGQGYFFSKPTSVSGAEKLISDVFTFLPPVKNPPRAILTEVRLT
jgi:diguanylate cyclase (GGDEF)-like protein/PAS domain S-box-containing protein